MSLFGFLDKVMDKLPIQQRKERWRNKIDELEKERNNLMKGSPTLEKTQRCLIINGELRKLERLCKNEQ